jgi:hypothetical protein
MCFTYFVGYDVHLLQIQVYLWEANYTKDIIA